MAKLKTALPKAALERRLKFACRLAREAGRLTLRRYRDTEHLSIETKGLQDYVSNADREIELLIKNALADAFPEDETFGEESGGTPKGLVWVIDPIDGTSNFLRRIPFFCVSIGLVAGRELEVGVIYDPFADELFAARRAGGATLNGKPIRVSTCTDLRHAVIGLGSSYRTSSIPYVKTVRGLLKQGGESRRLGSAAIALAYSACGRLDGFWELHLNSWDVAAGLLLVREAGGWTNDFMGAENALTRGGSVLACSPGLAKALRAATNLKFV